MKHRNYTGSIIWIVGLVTVPVFIWYFIRKKIRSKNQKIDIKIDDDESVFGWSTAYAVKDKKELEPLQEKFKDEIIFYFPFKDNTIQVIFYQDAKVAENAHQHNVELADNDFSSHDIVYASTKSEAIAQLNQFTKNYKIATNIYSHVLATKDDMIKCIQEFSCQIHFPVKTENPEDALSVEYDDDAAFIRICSDKIPIKGNGR